MKSLANILIVLTITLVTACGQGPLKTNEQAMSKFDTFILKEKFIPENNMFYPGLGNPLLKSVLTERINQSANDFKKLFAKGIASDKEYQDLIKTGLQRFEDVYYELDTEDLERICTYYEELMNIVGLESSGGHLNEFIYGFDPTK